jgi:sialic acid synthase SpsE
MGTNHDREKSVAKELIDEAAAAGVDAIKYQVYHAGDIVSRRIPAEAYSFEEYYDAETAYEVFDEHLRLPRSWFGDLTAYAAKRGLDNVATVHCPDCAEFVAGFDVQAFKIASMDLTHLPLLETLTEYDLPVVLSTGMASFAEIHEGVRALRKNGHDDVAVLHCVSNYPTEPSELNLQNVATICNAFDVTAGFSDHTLSTLPPALAVAYGASIIEKHFTLDRSRDGPDHPFALEPDELAVLVDNVEMASKAGGSTARSLPDSGKQTEYHRSIVADTDLHAGETITEESIRFARPGDGIEPKHFETVLGMTLQVDVPAEHVLEWDHFRN